MEKTFKSVWFEAVVVSFKEKQIDVHLTKVPEGWEGERDVTLYSQFLGYFLGLRMYERFEKVFDAPGVLTEEGENAVHAALLHRDWQHFEKIFKGKKVCLVFEDGTEIEGQAAGIRGGSVEVKIAEVKEEKKVEVFSCSGI